MNESKQNLKNVKGNPKDKMKNFGKLGFYELKCNKHQQNFT